MLKLRLPSELFTFLMNDARKLNLSPAAIAARIISDYYKSQMNGETHNENQDKHTS